MVDKGNLMYIDSPRDDIYFNLALEEYLLYHFKVGSYLLLWVSDRCIVLGRNQNVFEEIDVKSSEVAGLKVARRISGGGTVFHDKGNLNYSFITDCDPDLPVDYDRFINPVVSALNSIGIPAVKRGSSDIMIGDRKISGNAQASKKGRVLHHGTLLFDSDLSSLSEHLKPPKADIVSKSVKSRRSSVTNIIEHIHGSMTLEDLRASLLSTFFPEGVEMLQLTEEDFKEINELVGSKYSKWEWNYGRSPKFSFEKESRAYNGLISVKLLVEKGIVTSCTISGMDLPSTEIEVAVSGVRYSYAYIQNVLKSINFEELAPCFF